MALARMLTVSGNDVQVWSAIEAEVDNPVSYTHLLDGSTSLEFDPQRYPTVTRKCALVQMRYAGSVQE